MNQIKSKRSACCRGWLNYFLQETRKKATSDEPLQNIIDPTIAANRTSKIINGLLLLVGLLLCGTLSIFLGKQLCWDQANYHYYIAYALLHHRYTLDYWPGACVHQFLNPTMDLLPYYLINHFTPRMTIFLLGALHGINFWLLILIAQHFLQGSYRITLSVLFALIGLYGPTALTGIGSFQNDHFLSMFVLAFVLLQLKMIEFSKENTAFYFRYLIIGGVLLGLSAGLKLTAAIYLIGALAASFVLPMPIKQRCNTLFIWGCAITLGFLITNGYWMWMMWQQHHNPLFPFFNRLFHSPDFPFINWRDEFHLPQTVLQTLFYPFYFSWDGRTGDVGFRDVRFLIVYVLLIMVGAQWLWKKIKKNRLAKSNPLSLSQQWFYAFFIFSYIVWQSYFSIARYLIVLELLAPLMIYLLITQFIQEKGMRFIFIFTSFYLICFLLLPLQFARAPWYRATFFNITLPPVVSTIPNATVLIANPSYVMTYDPQPLTYLIPSFPEKWQFIGIPFFENEKFRLDKATIHHIKLALKKNSPFYLLTTDRNMPELYRSAQLFGLKPNGACQKINSDRQAILKNIILLCPVKS